MTEGPSLPSKPRIMLVAHEVKDRGGMERTLAQLLRQGHSRFDFIVVSMVLAEDLRPFVAEWRKVRAPMRPFPLRFLWFWCAAALVVTRNRADLVETMGAIVPNRVDVAAVQFCHLAYRKALGSWSAPETPRLRRMSGGVGHWIGALAERWCYRPERVRTLTASSEGLRGELRDFFPRTPTVLVPLGVDTERFSPRPELRATRAGTGPDATGEMVAAFVGGDWHRKGLRIAMSGLAHAVAQGANVCLWVDGPGQEGHFRQVASELGVAGRVRFLGAPLAVEQTYQSADLLLLPSAYETFSLVSHEAAACGIPIVATPVHGVAELVGRDQAGCLVTAQAESIGGALFRLWNDPVLRSQQGETARQRTEAMSWDRYGEISLEVFRHLLTDSPLRRS